MVLYKHGETLYQGTKKLIAENLDKLANEYIIPAFPAHVDDDPLEKAQAVELFLKAVRKVWDDHTSSLSKLRDVLKYMVRSNVVLHVWFPQRYIGPRIHEIQTSARDLGRRATLLH